MTDADLRAYLLGQTTEADAEQVEIRALDDEDFFATVQSVEDDLFDDYAHERMSPDERGRFIEKYGADRDRLRVAGALAARPGHHAPVVSLPATSSWWMAAAAAVLVAGVGITLGIPAKLSHDAPATSVPVAQSGPAPAAAAPQPVALLLTLGSARAAASAALARLPASAASLQLRVRIDPADRFDGYIMELRSDRDIVVWRAEALHASAANGDLTLVGEVPASSLDDGSYELSVLGSTAAQAPEALGFAAVKIAR